MIEERVGFTPKSEKHEIHLPEKYSDMCFLHHISFPICIWGINDLNEFHLVVDIGVDAF